MNQEMCARSYVISYVVILRKWTFVFLLSWENTLFSRYQDNSPFSTRKQLCCPEIMRWLNWPWDNRIYKNNYSVIPRADITTNMLIVILPIISWAKMSFWTKQNNLPVMVKIPTTKLIFLSPRSTTSVLSPWLFLSTFLDFRAAHTPVPRIRM